MKYISDSISHLLLALIIGVVSLGVSFIGDMSKNIQSIASSVQELNIKVGHVNEIIRDHELRLRGLEERRAK